MEKEKMNELLKKYNEGQADAVEVQLIEEMIASGAIEYAQLNDLHQLNEQLMQLEYPEPSQELDARFYEMLAKQKAAAKGFSWTDFFTLPQLAPRLALAVLTLLIGLLIGVLIRPSVDGSVEVAVLNQQLIELREMMLLSLLEKESPTERLRAVSLSHEMEEVSDKVTDALIQTLRKDPNNNVRLSALEALKPYVYKENVRVQLVQSISMQESPLIQVALAELMAAIQERSSVKELERILEHERTPGDVKKRIKESIEIMI